jgi:hypothetical protein
MVLNLHVLVPHRYLIRKIGHEEIGSGWEMNEIGSRIMSNGRLWN